jgi:C4-dicarboxylate-binding protein DctP
MTHRTALGALALLLASSAALAQEHTIRAAHVESTDSALHRGYLVFEAYVEAASGGAVAVEILPAAQLGGLRDALEQAKVGAIEVAQGDESNLDPFHPPMMVMSAPFFFENDEEVGAFLRGDHFASLNEAMAAEAGLRVLSGASYGFRNFTNNLRPIRTAADLEGMRMRVPPSPLSVAMVEAMGGSPTPIPFEELYGALQQGVVDGQENPLGLIHDYDFAQVQQYLTISNHKVGINFMVINDAFYQGLGPELQRVLRDGAWMAAATEYGERNYQSRVTAAAALEEAGMEVYYPTPDEALTFRTAAEGPVREFLVSELGEEVVANAYAAVADLRN